MSQPAGGNLRQVLATTPQKEDTTMAHITASKWDRQARSRAEIKRVLEKALSEIRGGDPEAAEALIQLAMYNLIARKGGAS
jgi:predicted neutral ceramidase superfamily lipid hydrolase